MASKKQQTAEALNPKGWQNQLGDAPKNKPPSAQSDQDKSKLKRKTYLFTDDLITRIEDTAKTHGVGVNELVRYLVTHTLNELDAGTHKLPVRVVTTYTLDI